MSATVLVTGAAGFLGSFLCESLIFKGYSVVGIDNFFRGKVENLSAVASDPHFSIVELDLADSNNKFELSRLIRENSVKNIFHLAAINGTQHFYDHSAFVLDQNVKITMNLMESIAGSEVQNFIYTSSSEVYGEPMILPTPEHHPILVVAEADRDCYAVSKAVGDFYTRLYANKYGINHLILRIFNLFGERMVDNKYGQVVPEFTRRMLFEDEFSIIGDGSQTRSFCYVRDATEAMVRLMEIRASGIVNLGNDEEITILELAQRLHILAGRKFFPVFLPGRANDHKRRRPDIKKLRELLPDLEFSDLDSGLQRVISYYKSAGTSSAVTVAGARQ
jgi:UDP-glucuronate decarboxylase